MIAVDAAIGYRRRGLSVIPVSGETKQPFLEWRRYQRTLADEATISKWFTKWPAAHVGIVTGELSGIIALDGDGPEGVRHLTSLGTTAFTPLVRTPRGGLHQFFRHPGVRISSGAGILPSLDVRGDGGYVVAPPSLRANGTGWKWLTSLDDFVPVELPDAVLALLLAAPHLRATAGPIPKGRRNSTLYLLGRSLWAKGLDVEDALLIENAARCQPRFSEAEVRRLAAHVTTQEHRKDFTPPDAAAAEVRAIASILRRRAQTWPFPSGTAVACQRVVDAHLRLIERSGRHAHGASLRQVAELSELSKSTVERVHNVLRGEGWLTQQKGPQKGLRRAAIWLVQRPHVGKLNAETMRQLTLGGLRGAGQSVAREGQVVVTPPLTAKTVLAEQLNEVQPPPDAAHSPTEYVPAERPSDAPLRALWNRVCPAQATDEAASAGAPGVAETEYVLAGQPHDVWCSRWRGKKGLGAHAGRLYAALQPSTHQTPLDLGLYLRRRARSLSRPLRALEGHGLAVRSKSGWLRGAASLDAVAQELGVAGRAVAIRDEHRRQRERFDEYLAGGGRLGALGAANARLPAIPKPEAPPAALADRLDPDDSLNDLEPEQPADPERS